MSRSKKKNKWKSLPSACRTCIVGMAVLIVFGLILIVYGKFSGIQASDKKTVDAEIVIDPKTETTYGFFGILSIAAGLLAGVGAFVLRPRRNYSTNPNAVR